MSEQMNLQPTLSLVNYPKLPAGFDLSAGHAFQLMASASQAVLNIEGVTEIHLGIGTLSNLPALQTVLDAVSQRDHITLKIYGVADSQAPTTSGIQIIELGTGTKLAREWFLYVNQSVWKFVFTADASRGSKQALRCTFTNNPALIDEIAEQHGLANDSLNEPSHYMLTAQFLSQVATVIGEPKQIVKQLGLLGMPLGFAWMVENFESNRWQLAMNAIKRLTRATRITLYFFDTRNEVLYPVVSTDDSLEPSPISAGYFLIDVVVQQQSITEYAPMSVMTGMPIMTDRRVWGVLELEYAEELNEQAAFQLELMTYSIAHALQKFQSTLQFSLPEHVDLSPQAEAQPIDNDASVSETPDVNDMDHLGNTIYPDDHDWIEGDFEMIDPEEEGDDLYWPELSEFARATTAMEAFTRVEPDVSDETLFSKTVGKPFKRAVEVEPIVDAEIADDTPEHGGEEHKQDAADWVAAEPAALNFTDEFSVQDLETFAQDFQEDGWADLEPMTPNFADPFASQQAEPTEETEQPGDWSIPQELQADFKSFEADLQGEWPPVEPMTPNFADPFASQQAEPTEETEQSGDWSIPQELQADFKPFEADLQGEWPPAEPMTPNFADPFASQQAEPTEETEQPGDWSIPQELQADFKPVEADLQGEWPPAEPMTPDFIGSSASEQAGWVEQSADETDQFASTDFNPMFDIPDMDMPAPAAPQFASFDFDNNPAIDFNQGERPQSRDAEPLSHQKSQPAPLDEIVEDMALSEFEALDDDLANAAWASLKDFVPEDFDLDDFSANTEMPSAPETAQEADTLFDTLNLDDLSSQTDAFLSQLSGENPAVTANSDPFVSEDSLLELSFNPDAGQQAVRAEDDLKDLVPDDLYESFQVDFTPQSVANVATNTWEMPPAPSEPTVDVDSTDDGEPYPEADSFADFASPPKLSEQTEQAWVDQDEDFNVDDKPFDPMRTSVGTFQFDESDFAAYSEETDQVEPSQQPMPEPVADGSNAAATTANFADLDFPSNWAEFYEATGLGKDPADEPPVADPVDFDALMHNITQEFSLDLDVLLQDDFVELDTSVQDDVADPVDLPQEQETQPIPNIEAIKDAHVADTEPEAEPWNDFSAFVSETIDAKMDQEEVLDVAKPVVMASDAFNQDLERERNARIDAERRLREEQAVRQAIEKQITNAAKTSQTTDEGFFSSVVSFGDLRTFMSRLRERINRVVAGNTSARSTQGQLSQQLIQETDSAVEILNDLSRLTHPSEEQTTVVDLSEMISDVIRNMNKSFGTAPLKINIIDLEEDLQITAIQTYLIDAMDSLFDGAMQLLSSGSAEVHLRPDETDAVLKIQLYPVNMSQERLEKRIRYFTKGVPSHGPLALAHLIIRHHGGAMIAQALPDQSSVELTVSLPMFEG